MIEFDPVAVGTLAIRAINATLWTAVCIRVIRAGKPMPRVVRNLSATVILSGMWVLAIGGLAPFGVPGDSLRFVYTTFTAYAGLIALAVASTKE